MKFKPGNKLFENTEVWRILGADSNTTSGIKWKSGMSPGEKNKAEGKKDTSEDTNCSLFELFEGEEADEDVLTVAMVLYEIALDPVSAYQGES